ncbi:unnamed protein product [Clavelina lepadiformis]|uniref:CS domain-containing protein n=1 Tax=Clavelina lepadiformis TaxID=159417 RepID=A0ABP0EYQ7_CLALP
MSTKANKQMIAAYDNTLLGILQNEAGLEPFLDVIFGFLFRRTDFYRTMTSPKQRFGFYPGVAEKMVLSYFKKYHNLVLDAEAKNEAVQASKATEPGHKHIEESCAVQEKTLKAKPSSKGPTKTSSELRNSSEKASTKSDKTAVKEISGRTPEQNRENPTSTNNDQTTFQSNPDSYNGAIRDKYSWSQNYDDVDVKIPIGKSVKKAKQVFVDIQRNHLKVLVKPEETDEFETIIDGDLQHEVSRLESMWSLEAQKHIDITLTKEKNIWWSMLVLGEDEIDIQKICPERSMADMDEEEVAVINKLKFDDHQKKLGLPQSHELKVHDMLKKGWDAEGSPFKRQEFDPKMFNVSPGGVE